MERKELIRTVYLYLFSLLGLVLITIGAVRLVDLGLKTWIFKRADQVILYPEYPRAVKPGTPAEENELTPEEQDKFKAEQLEYQKQESAARKERTAANSIAMILVGTPLFLYHWKVIQRGKEEKKSEV